ncbi:hypothetical protein BH18THE1_BH18THE1_10350 [soil metagenome]
MYNRELFEICDGNHIMLVYDGNEAKLDAAAHFINEGLVNNQLCIYASVHAFDNENNLSISNLKTRIKDYDTNLKEDNLLFIDFKPYYESAAEAKLGPFKFLKQKIETMLRNRVSDSKQAKILVFADAACTLTEGKEFEESTALETWWQYAHDDWTSNHLKITVICPHPAHILRKEVEAKWQIADVHDIMVFLNSHLLSNTQSAIGNRNNLRILVVDAEPDIMTLYSDFLCKMGHDVSVMTDGNKCLSLFKKRDFDLVILDTHIKGAHTSSDIAKEILRIEPHQRILMTSTYSPNQMTNLIAKAGLDKNHLLQKPFHLSELLKTITEIAN